MQALCNGITKEEMITSLKWHQEQDNFVKGRYFKDGKEIK